MPDDIQTPIDTMIEKQAREFLDLLKDEEHNTACLRSKKGRLVRLTSPDEKRSTQYLVLLPEGGDPIYFEISLWNHARTFVHIAWEVPEEIQKRKDECLSANA